LKATDIKNSSQLRNPSSMADNTLRPSPLAISSEDVAKLIN